MQIRGPLLRKRLVDAEYKKRWEGGMPTLGAGNRSNLDSEV